jgi:hypothetical protein
VADATVGASAAGPQQQYVLLWGAYETLDPIPIDPIGLDSDAHAHGMI